MLCLKKFSRAVVNKFGSDYLRLPNQDYTERIEEQFAGVGFPGCIGAVDCTGWAGGNCPTALHGIHKGKPGVELRIEVVCDLDPRIWHCFFGLPGSMNDLNIPSVNPFFNAVLPGKVLPENNF
eukprot:Plantae.Rhodophyta-Rhodochaete_pulchella.ctg72981.p1 GENE.Plantae.Rhodophyta-Rhodochaete_pulchella.ctg72981~~Plantae.Rhodophyta-Rhodochaete_pulchella.ctg72981.p1  ORF type:complete len:123 (+),score=8.19 Plantae.Rhodophyta-Rhodochaete_pulchella.ctg72981:357-725(+)